MTSQVHSGRRRHVSSGRLGQWPSSPWSRYLLGPSEMEMEAGGGLVIPCPDEGFVRDRARIERRTLSDESGRPFFFFSSSHRHRPHIRTFPSQSAVTGTFSFLLAGRDSLD